MECLRIRVNNVIRRLVSCYPLAASPAGKNKLSKIPDQETNVTHDFLIKLGGARLEKSYPPSVLSRSVSF